MLDKINVDDINYAVYKVGNWNNSYKINQIGLSNEIPVTKSTYDHVKSSMDEIRMSEFDLDGEKVNGFIAIAYSLNPEIQKMDVSELIKLEQNEFDLINSELDSLELLCDGTISLDSEDYLIYKLEKECHVTKSIPANDFTLNYYNEELKKIKDSLS